MIIIYLYIFSISLSIGKTAVTKNPGCQNDGNEKQKKNGGGKETEQKKLHRLEKFHENHENYQ